MKYRKFGKLNWKVSALGFGAMRLPVIDNDPSKINEEEAIKMIRYAIDHGVNYVDTAYMYHRGNSEILVGKALSDGYQAKVKLATKMPTGMINSQEDMDRILNDQLRKLNTDHIDFYLLHGLNGERWHKVRDLNVLEWAKRTIGDGRIRHLGFSFHDTYDTFKEIVDSSNLWTMCQMQYNYMDTESSRRSPGTEGVKYAHSKGLAVVVMEPILGGTLAIKPLPEIQAIWDEAKIKRTPAEWALQWVWNQPEVSVALSGMSTMEQVVENVESGDRSGPNALNEKELELISRVREGYLEHGFVGCTGCRYCVPCPQGVEIPVIFAYYNEHYKKRGDAAAQQEVIRRYGEAVPLEKGAKRCAKCGECEQKCPQQLTIRNLLTRAVGIFERDR